MASSIFGAPQTPPSRPSNPLQMIAEFKRFASGITPQQAEQEVNRLLQSGQMSKDQFEQLKQQAKSFMGFFK